MDLSQNSPVHGADTLKTTTAYQRLIKKIELFDVLPETAFVDNKLVYVVCDRSPSSIQRDVKAGLLLPHAALVQIAIVPQRPALAVVVGQGADDAAFQQLA